MSVNLTFMETFTKVIMEKQKAILYLFSLQDIGSALGTSSCIIVMVKKHDDYAELYDEVYTAMKDLPLPL